MNVERKLCRVEGDVIQLPKGQGVREAVSYGPCGNVQINRNRLN